ncbi:head-tail connector protein [Rhizobiaceae bacterium n13]|uniref:head-tail connector protein n=1 Tax=Ferirhizobium litorale TaxID=2927786 RepID=UPI0024B2FB7D|nr:head-tail connector protein [Fererhizobium litorale]MDI7864089.1 head-tail connector protein [Fererhizobium litorale]
MVTSEIVSIDELKRQLNIVGEVSGDEYLLLQRKIVAAEGYIQRLLGFKLDEVTYPDDDDYDFPDTVPAPLKEAILQLAAHWYENREATLVGVSAQELPLGVQQIVNEYREYSFDGGE